MRDIRLILKNVWYRQIRDYRRDEVYTDITPWWQSRLCKNYDANDDYCSFCKTNHCKPVSKSPSAHITLGRPTDSELSKHRYYPILNISKGYGKFIWGAPRHKCFIIHLDKSPE